jgi:hypothetical protein
MGVVTGAEASAIDAFARLGQKRTGVLQLYYPKKGPKGTFRHNGGKKNEREAIFYLSFFFFSADTSGTFYY